MDGWQHQDGTVERYIALYDVREMNAAQAQELAAALPAAADALTTLTPGHPLDRYSTDEILDEIARRTGMSRAEVEATRP